MKNENPFKEKLFHHTLPVSDDLWNRIEPQLPLTGRKKRFPFLWLSILAIVLSAGALVMLQDQSGPLQPQEKQQQQEPSPIDSTIAGNIDDISSNYSKGEYTPSNSDEKPFASIATSEPLPISNLASSAPALMSKNNERHQVDNNTTHLNSNFNVADALQYDANYLTVNEPLISSAFATNSMHAVVSSTENIDRREQLYFPHLTQKEYSIIEKDDFVLKNIFKIKPDPSCYEFTGVERRSNLSIDVFAAPGFSPRTFRNTTAESVVYAEARDKTENNRYAMSFGARVNLNLSNEVAVRAGMMYEVIGDVFGYVDSAAMRSSTHIDSFFSSNGTFLYADTVRIFEPGTQVKRIHNRYHHLDIPILLSYELPLGRARLMVNAGPVFNLAAGYRGQILDPMLVPRHITRSASNPIEVYKQSLGMSLYLGAGALIPISKYFSGLIEPRFLYRIKPVTLESYPLDEYRHYAGVNLGLRYHFQ